MFTLELFTQAKLLVKDVHSFTAARQKSVNIFASIQFTAINKILFDRYARLSFRFINDSDNTKRHSG